MTILAILAQTTTPSAPPPWWLVDPTKLFLPLILLVVVFFLFSSSKNRRNEEKARQDMLKNLKRGDRVQTIGGVFGTVVDARPSDVVLKVDESSNTKIKFSREAIKRVVTDEETASK